MNSACAKFFGAAALCAVALPAWPRAGAQPVDGFAATVNDRVITVSSVMEVVQPVDRKLQAQYAGTELQKKREEAFEYALETLIQQALILEEFKALGGAMPERLVRERADSIIRDQFGNDRMAFQDALVEQRMTLEEWRDQTRENLVVNALRRQEVGDRLTVNPIDVYRLYEKRRDQYRIPAQSWLRVITIKRDDDAPARATEARGQLLAGQDFSKVAKDFSSDNKTDKGGDWGWVDVSILRKELMAAIEKTSAGELGPLVETEDAFYLFRVEERRPAGLKTFEEVRGPLEEEVRRAESARLFDAWMKRLRRKHYVKIF